MTSAVKQRMYAIVTGSDAGYLLIEPVEDEYSLQGFDMAGQPRSITIHKTPQEARSHAAETFGPHAHGWWVIPLDEPDALRYARDHITQWQTRQKADTVEGD